MLLLPFRIRTGVEDIYFQTRAQDSYCIWYYCPDFHKKKLQKWQFFLTFSASRHPYEVMQIFVGTPSWWNRYTDLEIYNNWWHPWHSNVSRTLFVNHCCRQYSLFVLFLKLDLINWKSEVKKGRGVKMRQKGMNNNTLVSQFNFYNNLLYERQFTIERSVVQKMEKNCQRILKDVSS